MVWGASQREGESVVRGGESEVWKGGCCMRRRVGVSRGEWDARGSVMGRVESKSGVQWSVRGRVDWL